VPVRVCARSLPLAVYIRSMGAGCSATKPAPVAPQQLNAALSPRSPNTADRFRAHGHNAHAMASFTAAESQKRTREVSGASGTLSLPKTLRDDEASGAFMAFARADLSEENLEFWFTVNDFKDSWDKREGDEAGQRALAMEIIGTFLKPSSSKQVCIGDRRVGTVIDAAEGGSFSKDMFDEPQQIAELTLAQDIFPRFVECEAGRKLAFRSELCEGDAPPKKPV
jgi:hypothetical protein